MEDHEMFVKFAEYCQSCRHRDLGENEEPCGECLEHPVNLNTHEPYCYKQH